MKASVIVFAYNHERFIQQALDSVLAQETSFDFEILISEDCSTDATRQIVQEYVAAHPGKIRLLLSEKNVRSPYVAERALDVARGEFVAFLDGDDYWLSALKLQKQVEFMERRPELTMSWHNRLEVDREGRPLSDGEEADRSRTRVDIRSMLENPVIAIPVMVMIRRAAAFPIPAWYRTCPTGDHPLWILALRSGQGAYLDEVLAAYRVHNTGLMNGLEIPRGHELLLQTYRCFLRNLEPEYRPVVCRRLARLWQGKAALQRLAGDAAAARRSAREGLRDCPGDWRLRIFAYAPWLWKPLRACAGLMLTQH